MVVIQQTLEPRVDGLSGNTVRTIFSDLGIKKPNMKLVLMVAKNTGNSWTLIIPECHIEKAVTEADLVSAAREVWVQKALGLNTFAKETEKRGLQRFKKCLRKITRGT